MYNCCSTRCMHGLGKLMNKAFTRLVSLASLLAFLIANGPGGGVVRFLTPSCSTCTDQDVFRDSSCAACGEMCSHDCETCADESDECQFAAQEGCGNPLCTVCASQGNLPLCPCPGGCSFCSVAKAPCTASLPPTLTAHSRPESCVAEAALHLPPKHCTQLLRPPRA
jgi:hypothetical protein